MNSFIDLTPDSIIRCPFDGCNTRLIKRGSLKLVSVKGAPEMTKLELKEVDENEGGDNYSKFFKVDDVWDFDNIGVSRPTTDLNQPEIEDSESNEKLNINVMRLLICSECDRGALGFAGIPNGEEEHHTKLVYFLARDSVKYDN